MLVVDVENSLVLGNEGRNIYPKSSILSSIEEVGECHVLVLPFS